MSTPQTSSAAAPAPAELVADAASESTAFWLKPLHKRDEVPEAQGGWVCAALSNIAKTEVTNADFTLSSQHPDGKEITTGAMRLVVHRADLRAAVEKLIASAKDPKTLRVTGISEIVLNTKKDAPAYNSLYRPLEITVQDPNDPTANAKAEIPSGTRIVKIGPDGATKGCNQKLVHFKVQSFLTDTAAAAIEETGSCTLSVLLPPPTIRLGRHSYELSLYIPKEPRSRPSGIRVQPNRVDLSLLFQ